MSTAFNKIAKRCRKIHKERSQLPSRQHLGILEKKKDYQLRTAEHKKKENTLKFLRKKALDKNPDEFYFNMVNSKTVDGVHEADDKVITYTDDQLKLMQSQDIRYIQYKRSLEKNKIEKLKASLQLIDVPDCPKNTHIIFCETEEEAKNFDAAKYFDTHPSLVDRAFNRTRTSDLKNMKPQEIDDADLAAAAVEKEKRYSELVKRIEREKQLAIIEEKLSLQKALMDKKTPKKKISEESKDSAAVYRWVYRRKR